MIPSKGLVTLLVLPARQNVKLTSCSPDPYKSIFLNAPGKFLYGVSIIPGSADSATRAWGSPAVSLDLLIAWSFDFGVSLEFGVWNLEFSHDAATPFNSAL